MIAKRIFILILTYELTYINSYGQFFTIYADSTALHAVDKELMKIDTVDTSKALLQDSIPKNWNNQNKDITEDELFPSASGLEITVERNVPLFVSVKKNPLLELIKKRITVCLPLDYMKKNSSYGYRNDPVYKCPKFHDGIDLQCNYENVYAMLPGFVKEVHHGKRGYGNYVILQHGDIECLYGHLSMITVKEEDVVQAGDIVAISGNTGKTTGPHLHLRLKKNGKSVDPQPFISYLNDYIDDLQDKISTLKFGTKPNKKLNIATLAETLKYYHIKYPRIVIAQALLETGYFTSRVCTECNNLFGLRRPSNGNYYVFEKWEDSVKAYRDYVQYKYKGGDYFQFLNRIGYAEDREYVYKIWQIAKAL